MWFVRLIIRNSYSYLRWAAALPLAAASYAAVRLGVVTLVPQLHVPLLGPLSGWILSDWTGSLLFIAAATAIAPARKHYAAGSAFVVLSIAHTVMLLEATKNPFSPELFSTETLYVSALGSFFVSALATFAIIQHYRSRQRESEMIADARRYYREWADAPQQHPTRKSQAPVFSRVSSAPPLSSSTASVAQVEPVAQYEAKVLTNEELPRDMTLNLSLAFADENGRQKKFVVANGKSVGFIKTAFVLGIISPGHALKFVFKPRKAIQPTLLKNPAWFKSRREIDVDIPEGALASSESGGRNLLVDSLSEYRR